MSNLSLRCYLARDSNHEQGLRACFAPGMKLLSLRSLMSSLRIIHISDLHFTASDHTWDARDNNLVLDQQNSAAKLLELATFLIANKPKTKADAVVITGDLTDSGDIGGYKLAQTFIQQLKDNGFKVFVVPGNHDYCWEGNFFFEQVFEALLALPLIQLAMPGVVEATILTTLTTLLPGFPPPPAAFVAELAGAILSPSPEPATNRERRERFIDMITPYYQGQPKYPHIECMDKGYFILLDSLQGQLDEDSTDQCAQGRLGKSQLDALENCLTDLQCQRKIGKKIVVALHHSPFKSTIQGDDSLPLVETDEKLGLHDYRRLLDILNGKVDCLLFGHTTPPGQDHRPNKVEAFAFSTLNKPYFTDAEKHFGIPLINCENLEHMKEDMNGSYSVTLLDLSSYQRVVYQTATLDTEYTWGVPPEWA